MIALILPGLNIKSGIKLWHVNDINFFQDNIKYWIAIVAPRACNLDAVGSSPANTHFCLKKPDLFDFIFLIELQSCSELYFNIFFLYLNIISIQYNIIIYTNIVIFNTH